MARMPDRTVAARRGAASPCPPRRNSGVILIMTLLAIGLIVGLVFLVYNSGRFINLRVRMQNTADAVVISGAGWSARSMNVIAMNNCGQSRMIALVPVLDSLPLATEMALVEVTAWEKGLSSQLGSVPDTKDDYLREGLTNLKNRMADQRDILIGLDKAFSIDLDMRSVTNWQYEGGNGDAPHGSLWRTAKALEEFSYVTWQTSDVLAQASAVRYGEANGADVAMMLPLTPQVPAKVGEYMDFRPVIEGRESVYYDSGSMQLTGGAGGAIPDFVYPHRLGPWAVLYKWRHERWEGELGEFIPDDEQPEPGPPVLVDGNSGTGPGGRYTGTSVQLPSNYNPVSGHWEGRWSEIVGWTTYGPYRWALNKTQAVARRHVPDTYYETYIRTISEAKRSYMWSTPQELRTIHYPEWIYTDDYPAAKALAEGEEDPSDPSNPSIPPRPGGPGNGDKEIKKTLYYRVEMYSSISPDAGNYMSEGTYETNAANPRAIWMSGWQDAGTWGYEQVGNYVWRRRDEFQITYWPELGIEYTETNGEPDYHTVYRDIYYIWGGVDVGEDVDITNPCNWDEGTVLPRPLLFDPGPNGELEYRYDEDDYTKQTGYGFLGIARKKYTADVWPRRFVDISPIKGTLTIAQAKLFNNLSWDLWTQDWQVQLCPTSGWDEWISELDTAQWEVDQVEELVDYRELAEIDRYLRSIGEDMMKEFMKH